MLFASIFISSNCLFFNYEKKLFFQTLTRQQIIENQHNSTGLVFYHELLLYDFHKSQSRHNYDNSHESHYRSSLDIKPHRVSSHLDILMLIRQLQQLSIGPLHILLNVPLRMCHALFTLMVSREWRELGG